MSQALQEGLQDAASVAITNDFKVNKCKQCSSNFIIHHIRKHRMLMSIINIFKLHRLTPCANLASPSMQKTEGRYEFSRVLHQGKTEKTFQLFFFPEDLLAISQDKLQNMD